MNSCYADCPPEPKSGWAASKFLEPTDAVRNTLEQIDVAKLIINKYSETFQFAKSSDDVRDAVSKGKIASLLGLEG
jgi:membrane dipeptidase